MRVSLASERTLWLAGLLAVGVVIICGCKVGPDYHKPDVLVPTTYVAATQPATGPTTGPTTRAATQPTTQSIAEELSHWWDRLGDPELSSLIGRATKGNLDIKLALARLQQARATLGFTSSFGQVQVDGVGQYTRSQISKNLGAPVGGPTDFWNAGFDANWELDVFGGYKRAVEAAQADLAGSVESVRNVLISVEAEVAVNYVELRGAQKRLAVAQENLTSQEETLKITQAKVDAGLANDVDLSRIQAQMASTRAQLPTFQASISDSIYRLSVLLGKGPGELVKELSTDKPIPVSPPEIPAGQPGELLQRRPDIRGAEQALISATAKIGQATADLYPKFSFIAGTNSLGLQSNQFKNWWQANSLAWSIGPSVDWSILNGGRVNANIQVQNALQQQALIQYQQIILQSVQEVESGLTRYAQEQQRRVSLQQAVDANTRAVTLSRELYAQGLVDFNTVLDAERAMLLSEDELVLSEQNVTSDAISIYKALGGGWQ